MALALDVPPEVAALPTPQCEHGPTLLFQDSTKQKAGSSLYYACSVSRDHRLCPFRCSVDQWKQRSRKRQKQVPQTKSTSYEYLLDREGPFSFCHDCCRVLIDKSDVQTEHRLARHRACRKTDRNVSVDFF